VKDFVVELKTGATLSTGVSFASTVIVTEAVSKPHFQSEIL
jgi:hypothetical protein